MDTLVASHPNLITKVHIGNSYENRPMYALKVKSGTVQIMWWWTLFNLFALIPVQHGWCESPSDLGWCWNPLQGVGYSGFCCVDRQQGKMNEIKWSKNILNWLNNHLFCFRSLQTMALIPPWPLSLVKWISTWWLWPTLMDMFLLTQM